jgi:hypothetical protein
LLPSDSLGGQIWKPSKLERDICHILHEILRVSQFKFIRTSRKRLQRQCYRSEGFPVAFLGLP